VNLTAVTPTLTAKDTCTVYYLGTVAYQLASLLQEKLLKARHQGEINDDIVLVLQHPPVLTVGKSGLQPEHILVSRASLKLEGIPLCNSSRGGGITYHGPGQLLCYPIFDLRRRGITVRQYLHNLEDAIIDLLAGSGIIAHRSPDTPGIRVNDAEIASIGIYVSHGITMHGFTLNVNTDLSRFSYISVCGVPGKKMTSVAQLSGTEPNIEDFFTPMIRSLGRVFHLDMQSAKATALSEYFDE
jgi:lipoate-protein ligase B